MSAISELMLAEVSLTDLWQRCRTGLRRGRDWWISEFRLLCPAWLLARIGAAGEPMVQCTATEDGVRVDVLALRGDPATPALIPWHDFTPDVLDRHLAGAGLTRGKVKLGIVLPAVAFFQRTFDIPIRARERVQTLVREELEHRTPFRADRIYFSTSFHDTSPAAGLLRARQTIIRRDLVLGALGRLGLQLEDIAFATHPAKENDGPAAMVWLHEGTQSVTSSILRLTRALGLVALLLSCADLALLWWTRESRLIEIESLAASERAKAVAVRAVEQDLDRLRESLLALAERRRRPRAIDQWRETTRLLPDETWLTDWRLRGDSLTMAGLSRNATDLVRLFEASPAFRDATLDAPITLDAITGHERFSVIAHISTNPRPAQRQE